MWDSGALPTRRNSAFEALSSDCAELRNSRLQRFPDTLQDAVIG
ncbi:hypothetical protein [Streptomyces bauhiniae]|nr:hypothetical protein [Streptomyces bauhiniae]